MSSLVSDFVFPGAALSVHGFTRTESAVSICSRVAVGAFVTLKSLFRVAATIPLVGIA